CPTWLTFTPSPNGGLLCAGQTGTIIAAGAVSYTWSTGATTSSIVVTPTTSTCYTISASNASGCNITTTACFLVFPHPTLSIAPSNPAVCAGNSATLTAAGATNYTWQPGNISGPSMVVTPTTANMYTVVGANATGCTSTSTVMVNVNPLPNITISGSG